MGNIPQVKVGIMSEPQLEFVLNGDYRVATAVCSGKQSAVCSEGKVLWNGRLHDELLFEVKEDFEAEAKKFIEQAMEQAATLSIPLSVGIGVSDNWCDAH